MEKKPVTPFIKRLLASRLLDAEQIKAARAVAGRGDRALARHLVQQGLLTRFQVRQLYMGASSFRVDKYIILDCLGRGGNGVVFKARHSLMAHRLVALKTLDSQCLHGSDEALTRFRREIDIVTRLDHPNVVRALDVVSTRTQIFLVLEYVEGSDLGTLVRERGRLPVAEAVGYAVQAARGLAYAHRQGVVHRDIKPANLLLTRDGVVKLSDMGLARFPTHDADGELTAKGICLGTPEFMAPEQAEDASQADARSDLYSLGATLFHLLTGELPVAGRSYLQCLQRLLTAPPTPLAESRPEVPAGLAAVVDRLRARNPDERPASAEETIALLEPFTRDVCTDQWDGQRRAELVLEVLCGQLTAADVCARHGLAAEEFERWQQLFLEAAAQALEPVAAPTSRETVADMDGPASPPTVKLPLAPNAPASQNGAPVGQPLP
jgi:serine/threonine protein kinase